MNLIRVCVPYSNLGPLGWSKEEIKKCGARKGGEEAGCKGSEGRWGGGCGGGGAPMGLERCEGSGKVKPTFLRQDKQCG